MRLDELTKPISPDAPCGEDLMETGDGDFLAYYFDAEAKMPERYVSLTTDEAFDKTSIDLKAELKQIEALSKRTIDLRLIALDVRFNILAGRIKGFCEGVIAMANVCEAFWEDVHPQIIDGEFFERQNAIEFIDTRATVTAPLEYAPIIIDRRAGEVTWRGYQVASGAAEAREEEAVGDAGAMTTALGSPENAQDVDAIHGLLLQAQDAVKRIVAAAKSNGAPFTPSLDKVSAKIAQIVELIESGRSDLAGGEKEGGEDAAAEDGAATAASDGAPAKAAAAPAPAGSVTNMYEARAALMAAETYFRTREPSSPALILVNQARQLVGRPLVEAIERLMPQLYEEMKIDFGSEKGFVLAMDRMNSLSEQAMYEGPGEEPEVEPRTCETRDQALAEMKAVENYYQANEPASAIPVLMFKARGFINKDFQSIIRDLMPRQEEEDY